MKRSNCNGEMTMKFSFVGIITIILVIVVVFTGCIDSAAPAPSITALQITPNVAETRVLYGATYGSQPATTVQATVTENPVKIFNGDYHWVEYQNNISVTMPPNPRSHWIYTIKMERSTEKYQNSPAIHYKFISTSDYPELAGDIVTITKDGRIAIHDFYYDAFTNRFLGDTMTETIKGVLKPAVNFSVYYKEHYREDSPGGYLGIEPFGEMNISLTYIGTESVTIPSGTYPEARKYFGSFRDGTPITFWVVPGVPVPAQYQFPNKYLDGVDPFELFELKGWG
jgi:hypothetical protein